MKFPLPDERHTILEQSMHRLEYNNIIIASEASLLVSGLLPSGRVMMTYGGCAATYVITIPVTAHKKGSFSVVQEGIEYCRIFTHIITTSKITPSRCRTPPNQSNEATPSNVARLTMTPFLFILPVNHWQRMSMLSLLPVQHDMGQYLAHCCSVCLGRC